MATSNSFLVVAVTIQTLLLGLVVLMHLQTDYGSRTPVTVDHDRDYAYEFMDDDYIDDNTVDDNSILDKMINVIRDYNIIPNKIFGDIAVNENSFDEDAFADNILEEQIMENDIYESNVLDDPVLQEQIKRKNMFDKLFEENHPDEKSFEYGTFEENEGTFNIMDETNDKYDISEENAIGENVNKYDIDDNIIENRPIENNGFIDNLIQHHSIESNRITDNSIPENNRITDNSIRGSSMEDTSTEKSIMEKISNTIDQRTKGESVEQLVQMVLATTKVERPFIVNMLRDTLEDNLQHVPRLMETLENFEQRENKDVIPKTVISSKMVIRYDDTWNNHGLPLLVSTALGGVGNVMGQYATAFALHRIFNIPGMMASTLKENLARFFENLSMESVDIGTGSRQDKERDGWTSVFKDTNTAPSTYHGLQLASAGLLGPKRFLTAFCPIEVQLFSAFHAELRKEFLFNDYLLNRANDMLSDFARQATMINRAAPPTFIGIHIRLKDYVKHAESRWGVVDIPSKYQPYLNRAMQYYKDRFENTVFVMASDDLEYMQDFVEDQSLKNVFISHGTQGEDLSLLTRCNHSIVTLGTFGFWSAYLKPSGETIYPEVTGELAMSYHFTRQILEEAQVENFIPMTF